MPVLMAMFMLLPGGLYAASSSNINTHSHAAPAESKELELPVAAASRVAVGSAELARIEEYLNSLTTIVADFTQVAPDGSITSGKFSLKRPGKMRWQYDPPTPILMVANGGEIVFYDYELEQVSHIPLESTLAGFIAKPTISFSDKAISVDKVESTPGVLRVSLTQQGKRSEGSLVLEFSDNPIQIRNMVVTDAQGQMTTVSLNNARFGQPLDNSLFIFKDPRQKRRT